MGALCTGLLHTTGHLHCSVLFVQLRQPQSTKVKYHIEKGGSPAFQERAYLPSSCQAGGKKPVPHLDSQTQPFRELAVVAGC